jgi:transposase
LERTALTNEELRRVEILSRVAAGTLSLKSSAEMMGVSYRQAKRLWRRFSASGGPGLKHGNAGKRSNRAKSAALRRKVLRLIRKKYSGTEEERFGPTLAAEHLASEDGVEVDAETLRRWMLEEGLWTRQRKRPAHRKRRERKDHFGELVQMDGSFHAWLEQRGPEGCLMNLVDDATSTTLSHIGAQETIWAAAGVLRQWIDKYGVPLALYTDWKNVYVREPTDKELLGGEVPVTQFGEMCERLGIRIIAASSPQAKGRVERNHGTHQDRMVKKLRRKKIATYDEANAFLKQEYLPEHNRRFSIQAASPEDFHTKAPGKRALDDVFRLEEGRTIGNDWVVRYQNRLLQVERTGRQNAPAKAKVTVCEWEDGRIEIRYRGERIAWHEIEVRPAAKPATPVHRRSPKPVPPSPEHPWRDSYQNMRVG